MAGLNFTEKELEKILKNGKISLSADNKKSCTKIIIKDIIVSKKSSSSVNIHKIIQANKESVVKYTISEGHITIVFEGAILLSVNQIFSFLQREKQQQFFFMYKKMWHNKIQEALALIKAEKNTLPFFEKDIELTLFRQAPREIDKDAITTMFKFIIDGLKRTKETPLGILADDNPKVIHSIKFYNEKGLHFVGIKLKVIKNQTPTMSVIEFLKT